MKAFALLLVAGSLCFAPAALACGDQAACAAGAHACAPEQISACVKKLSLDLKGVQGQVALAKFVKDVKGMKGVEGVHLNAKDRRAVVDYCSMEVQDPKVLLAAITKAGYKAEVAKAKKG